MDYNVVNKDYFSHQPCSSTPSFLLTLPFNVTAISIRISSCGLKSTVSILGEKELLRGRGRGGRGEEGLMKMRRGIEGKDINGVVKNKNEDWSSVWSSRSLCLSPAAQSFQSMSKS